MDLAAAWQDPIYRNYTFILLGLLLGVGLLLGILRLCGKQMDSVWRTYTSWLIMAPAAVLVIGLGRVPTLIFFVLAGMLTFKEFARTTGLYRDWWMTGGVYLGIIALGGAAWMNDPNTGKPGWYGLYMAMPVYVLAALLLIPVLRNKVKGQLQAMALGLLGFLYMGWMLGHAGFLANCPQFRGYLLYLLFAVELNDVAAFTFGKLFGKHPLRNQVSPKKTWEGSIGAFCFSMALPWLLHFSFPHFGTTQLILTGLIVGIGGQLGDLVISVIKRDLNVKDMGALIPGHGGILDRVDSLIYTAPLFLHMVDYYYKIW